MVNVLYHSALRYAALKRKFYAATLPVLASRNQNNKEQVDITVYTMSCERDLPEQAACIHSFLRNVGEPKQFAVVSDGSYTRKSIALLERISPSVKVISLAEILRDDLPLCIKAYADRKPLGKKLAILWSIPVDGTTIYTDSDVLFFQQAKELVKISQLTDESPWYLPDLSGALDQRMLQNDSEKSHPVNAGFMVLKKRLDWRLGVERLELINGQYDFFSEQTMMHLTLHKSGARPLDPSQFILQVNDQFQFSNMHENKKTAIRHYVTGVRHKFWLAKTC